MSGLIGAGVTLEGFPQDSFQFTFLLASGITAADVGKAVAIDTSAANTVKLVGDNEEIFGRLETFEDRTNEGITVGTVATKGGFRIPTTGSPSVGDTLDGSATVAGSGETSLTVDHSKNVVVEVGTGYAIIVKS